MKMKKIKKRKINKKRIFALLVSIFIILFTAIIISNLQENYVTKSAKTKVILICLDGATWNVIIPLIDEGELPNFAKLMKKGAYGDFICDPPLSPQSWTSIATGMNEEKHGIHDFYITLPEKTEIIPMNRLMIKTKTLWEILNENNKKVGLLNWLITWPPQKLEGFVIPSWMKQDNSTYPPNLIGEIENNVNIKRFEGNLVSWANRSDNLESFFEYEMIETDNLIKTSQYLLKKYNLHLFAVGFYFTNEGQHLFWKYMEPQYFNVTKEEVEKFGDAIPTFYRKIDNFIGRFMLDEDITLFVLSDHGMGRLHQDQITCLDYGTFIREYDELLNLMGLLYYKNDSKDIDWTRTKAYYCGGLLRKGFCINLKGRESNGIVEDGEFETLKTEIKNMLQNMIFLDENKSTDFWPGIKKSVSGEELSPSIANIFSNVTEDYHPDVTFNIHYCVEYKDAEDLLKKKILIDNKIHKLGDFIKWHGISADHEVEGILLMKGPNLKKDVFIENARNIDITPTILYLMGLPVGKNMDGRVLTEAINKEYLIQNPVNYVDSYDNEEVKSENLTSINKDIKEKLESLGYIN